MHKFTRKVYLKYRKSFWFRFFFLQKKKFPLRFFPCFYTRFTRPFLRKPTFTICSNFIQVHSTLFSSSRVVSMSSTLVRQFMYAIIAQCGNDFYYHSDLMWNQMWQFFEAQKLQFFKTLLEAVHSDFWENYTFENVENPEILK